MCQNMEEVRVEFVLGSTQYRKKYAEIRLFTPVYACLRQFVDDQKMCWLM